jgi:hypothetical protein
MAELTEKLQSLKAEDKGKKLSDGGSLQGTVRVKSNGKVSVFFSWRYKFNGKAKDLACGTWPGEKLKAKVEHQAKVTALLVQLTGPTTHTCSTAG